MTPARWTALATAGGGYLWAWLLRELPWYFALPVAAACGMLALYTFRSVQNIRALRAERLERDPE